MAKISTYIIDATPTLSDKVIGTDVNDLNMTKNYTIGDIVSLANTNIQLTDTRLFYGDATNNLAETSTLTYIVGGAGTLASDTVVMNGTAVLDVTHIDNDDSLAIGRDAMTGSAPIVSIAIGKNASGQNVGVTNCIAIGNSALNKVQNPDAIIAIGNGALDSAATAIKSVVIGQGAYNATGNDMDGTVAIGFGAIGNMNSITTSANTYVGTNVGQNSNYGGDYNNVAVGFGAIGGNGVVDEFNGNVAMGHESMTGIDMNDAVRRNVAIGHLSMPNIGGGTPVVPVEDNIAIGQNAGNGQSGQHNIAIGAGSGGSDLLGFFNVAMGTNALQNQTGGDFNVAIGNDALVGFLGGLNNTAIGKAASSTVLNFDNTTALGHNSQPLASNEIVLGDNNVVTLRCNTPIISGISDQRDKTNIQPLGLGVDFLMDLNPVSWDWDRRNGSMQGYKDSGFLAQELETVRSQYGAEEILRSLVDKTNPDQYYAAPSVLIPVLVKAIQELKAEINELKNG